MEEKTDLDACRRVAYRDVSKSRWSSSDLLLDYLYYPGWLLRIIVILFRFSRLTN